MLLRLPTNGVLQGVPKKNGTRINYEFAWLKLESSYYFESVDTFRTSMLQEIIFFCNTQQSKLKVHRLILITYSQPHT